MNENIKRHQVAIIGAGIGGLTAAAFLQRHGIDVHVYERAPKLEEVGAGINLDSNAIRVLLRLGISEEELLEVATPLDVVWEFRNWDDGQVQYSEPFKPDFKAPHVVIHRSDLQNLIKKKVSKEAISLDHSFVNLEQNNEGVKVTFENGITVEADLVIGADGARSKVRDAIVTAPPMRFWTAAYRSLVPINQVPDSQHVPNRTAWLGSRQFFMRYPVSGGKLINLVGAVPRRNWDHQSWVIDAEVEDFLTEFEGWDNNVQAMIKASPETKLWALYDMDPLERWSLNRVTLLGDAAHFSLPFLGQGAAQAMEDAEVLSGYLKQLNEGAEFGELLSRYEALRKPRASMVQFVARTIWNFIDPPGTDLQDKSIPGDDIFNAYKGLFNMHDWLNGYELQKDVVM